MCTSGLMIRRSIYKTGRRERLLSYDRYAFERKSHAVSATTGISFEDFASMGTFARKNNGPAPEEWAMDNEKIVQVVVTRMRAYIRWIAGCHVAYPSSTEELEVLEKAAMAARAHYETRLLGWRKRAGVKKLQLKIIENHLTNTEQGIASLWARCAYLSFRLGMNSCEVASEIGNGITPGGVRCILTRLRRQAALFYPHESNYGGKAVKRLAANKYRAPIKSTPPLWRVNAASKGGKNATFDAVCAWLFDFCPNGLPDPETIRRDFWEPLRCEEIESGYISAALLSFAVHEGIREAVILLQMSVGVRRTGAMCDATLARANSDNPVNVARSFRFACASYYARIAATNPARRANMAVLMARAARVYA